MGEESVGKETNPPIQPPAREGISRFTKFRQWLRSFGGSSQPLAGTSHDVIEANLSVLSPPQEGEVRGAAVEVHEMPEVQQVADEEHSKESEEIQSVPSEEPVEETVPQHITGVATILAEKIEERGGVTPPEFEKRGAEAILGTNETMSDGFFEAIQQKNPDGYIVAVGAGNSFTLPYCFPEGNEPKELICGIKH